MHFTKEKLSEVATFATPRGEKRLRSFLELTQYFSTHIPQYAFFEWPLRDVLFKHDKSKKLKRHSWHYRRQSALVRSCSSYRMILITRSTFEKMLVIMDMEYTCFKSSMAWSIILSCFSAVVCINNRLDGWYKIRNVSIYMTLDKFMYLLHSRPFVLQTDSRNLSFLNNAKSS